MRRHVLALALVLSVPAGLAVPSVQAQPTQQRAAAVALNEGRHADAIRLITPVIQSQPRNPDALLLRARAYEARGDFGQAAGDYQRVLALRPSDASASAGLTRARSRLTTATRPAATTASTQESQAASRLLRADALARSRRWREASAEYAAYLDRSPGNPAIVQRYLIALAGGGETERGEAVAERYLRNYPTSADLYMRLGYFRLWQGERTSAIEAFEQALRLQPGNTEARQGLAQARQPAGSPSAGAPTSVIDRAFAAVRANPNDAAARASLADELMDVGRYYEAGQTLDAAPRSQRDAEWTRRRERARTGLERAGGSDTRRRATPGAASGPATEYPIDRLTRVVRQTPTDDASRTQLVALLLDAGRFFEARQNLDAMAARQRSTRAWQDAYARAERGLARAGGGSGRGGAEFPIDRLYRELRTDSTNDTKRFQLVDELVKYKRYGEAYEQLTRLQPGYGADRRWLDLFLQVDDAFNASGQPSPIFAIDRLSYRLAANPRDIPTRQALADALIDAQRYEEAYSVLTEGRFAAQDTPENRRRLEILEGERRRLRLENIARFEAQLASEPQNETVLRTLAALYLAESRTDDGLDLYRRVLEINAADSTRLQYARILQAAGYYDQAVSEAEILLSRDPQSVDARLLYAQSTLSGGAANDRTERYLTELLARDPDNAEVIINLAYLRFQQGNLDEAERLGTLAAGFGEIDVAPRAEILKYLIERERIRRRDASDIAVLNAGRVLSREGNFVASADSIERYFALRGRRTRDEVREYAGIFSAAGDFRTAIAIWRRLLEERYEYDIEKEIAKNLYYMGDYGGALATAERLARDNPRDYEVRFLLADAYRESGRLADAQRILDEARQVARASDLVTERAVLLDVGTLVDVSRGQTDWAPVFAPMGELAYAEGGGTLYYRWGTGLFTQISTPGRFVVSAGLMSHYQKGNRFLRPTSDRLPFQRLNQVFAGVYRDLSRVQIAPYTYDYTTRVQLRAGIIDTEGRRTVPFGEARFYAQDPEVWRANVGVQNTEGSYTLWSAAGGEYDLRLTQLDGRYDRQFSDSLFRVKGNLAYNIATDNLGSATDSTRLVNQGLGGMAEGSLRVLPRTYLGISSNYLSYQTQTDLYFSPRNYFTYEGFVEYEKGYPTRNYYLRLRAALGGVSGVSGVLNRRVEGDLIVKPRRNLSLVLSGGLGQSTRPLSFSDPQRYTIATFQGALYWSL